MNYFLKKTKKEKGIYLQIYYSYYSNNVKKQKCYKTLGYEADLKKQGIEDPISYYSNEVIKLREHNSNIQAATITESSQLISYGPYIINALIDYLNCSTRYFDTEEYKSIITSYLFFNKIYDYNNNPKYDKNLSKSENALRFMNGLTSTFYDNFFKNDKYIFLYYTGDYYITLNKAGIPYKIYRSHDKFHLDGHKIVNIYDYESNIEKNEYISYLNNSDTYEMPDIIGWSSSEVITFANLIHLSYNIDGYGKVTSSSINPGEIITQESILNVTLGGVNEKVSDGIDKSQEN